MPATPPSIPTSKRLDHLPVIAHAIRRLRVREVVDELVPLDPRSKISAGEGIEAMITAILLGKHTLYAVSDLLEPYDLQVAFGFNQIAEAKHFNDDRLAKALDDLFDKGGVAKVCAAATMSAIREFKLRIDQIHADLTSVSVYGDYENSVEPTDPDDPDAVPHLTYGYSKDHRPDLKQVVFGLSVTRDGTVPIHGRFASGNRGDGPETRYMLGQLRESVPDPSSVLYVGDSKLFSGETLAYMSAYDLSFVTLLPRSVGLWQEAYRRYCEEVDQQGEAPTLKAKGKDPKDRQKDPCTFWRGRSYDMPYEFRFDKSDHSIPLRLVVVESDALKDRKRGGFERRVERERLAWVKVAKEQSKRSYACERDAERARDRLLRKQVKFHEVEVRVREEQERRTRPGPGRPKKGEEDVYDSVWRLEVVATDDLDARERAFREETSFVLVTNVLLEEGEDRDEANRKTLRAYDDQDHVERAFRWLKHPLSVAPIFLKTEKRIAALGLVYVLSLMTYALIQRDVRQRLTAEKTTMPGNQGWTDRPTTNVIFETFRGLHTIHVGQEDAPVYVAGIDTEHIRLFTLFGMDFHQRRGVACVEPKIPRPGSRTAKPVPREKRSAKPRSRKQKRSERKLQT